MVIIDLAPKLDRVSQSHSALVSRVHQLEERVNLLTLQIGELMRMPIADIPAKKAGVAPGAETKAERRRRQKREWMRSWRAQQRGERQNGVVHVSVRGPDRPHGHGSR